MLENVTGHMRRGMRKTNDLQKEGIGVLLMMCIKRTRCKRVKNPWVFITGRVLKHCFRRSCGNDKQLRTIFATEAHNEISRSVHILYLRRQVKK